MSPLAWLPWRWPCVWILWYPLQAQRPGSCHQQQRVQQLGSPWRLEQPLQQHQQAIAGPHATAEFGNGGSAMPGPFTIQQHSSACQIETPLAQLVPQGMVTAPITKPQLRQTTSQLGAQCEVPAERTGPVVHQLQSHAVIMHNRDQSSHNGGVIHSSAMPLLAPLGRQLMTTLPVMTTLVVGVTGMGSTAAMAGEALWSLQSAMQGCIQSGQATACRQAEAQVTALTRNRAYEQASHLCKEEISELAQVVALMPIRDAVATDVMSSVADVQQACLPFGF